MSGEEKVKQSVLKRPITIMAVVGAAIATITALNTFTGLNFRPAWGYEIEQSIAADLKTQELLNQLLEARAADDRTFMELKKGQYELQLGMIERRKWELRKELADHTRQAKGYRNNSASIPPWLQNLVDDTAEKLDKLEDERREIERKVREYTSYLDAEE